MIHLLAHVDDTVRIGGGTRVWQFASVIRQADIGRGCSIGACSIVDGAIIGNRCTIGQAAQLHPGTRIGARVFVGPGAIFCNDVWPSVDKEGYGVEPGRCTVIVEDEATIGAGAIILPGVRIGKGSFVAAGAVVERELPAGSVLRRNGYNSQRPGNWRERRMRYAC